MITSTEVVFSVFRFTSFSGFAVEVEGLADSAWL